MPCTLLRGFSMLALVMCAAGAMAPGAAGQLIAVPVASTFDRPLGLVPYPGRPDTFLVFEQAGRVRVLRNGVVSGADFLDLRGDIASGGEQGLLGLALAPDFAVSGRVFLSYTDRAGDSVITRVTRSTTDPLKVDPASRFDLLWPGGRPVIEQPFTNHNGGHIMFGPDGYLYVGLGDGGSGDDPMHLAQDPTSLLGKMLRLDVSVPAGHPTGYVIPADNPFAGRDDVLGEIWALGLRNPWRWSFDDPATGGTGALVIGDVGQAAREEVNYEPAGTGGRNYGWRNREGSQQHVTSRPPFSQPLRDPVWEYARDSGRSITGGYVYRGRRLGPAYRGRYFFADFVTSRVWSLALDVDPATGEATARDVIDHSAELGPAAASPASFATDSAGELYLLGYDGAVFRIDRPGEPPGTPVTPPAASPRRPHAGSPVGVARPRP